MFRVVFNDATWIGLSDKETEDVWQWTTGEAFEFDVWIAGEPNNSGGNEDSVCIRPNGGWMDYPDATGLPFVMEIEIDNSSISKTVEWNGHKYELFNLTVSWDVAKAYCDALGGHLVTITSEEENAAVLELAGGQAAWIGYSDAEEEGNWNWVTDETGSYSNWGAGEPNNVSCGSASEDYAVLYSNWNDVYAHNRTVTSFVCEYDVIHTHSVSSNENITKQPTCTESGIKTISEVCSDCGAVISSNAESIPATGHVETQLVNAVEASCTAKGYTGDRVCVSCNAVIEAGAEIDLKNHIAAATVEENKTTAGYDSVTYCKDCHKELSRTHVKTAISESDPVIVVGNAQGKAGDTVTVNVAVKNNPGMNTFTLAVDYDQSAMTLTNVEGNPSLGGTFTIEKKITWLASKDSNYNGDILTLTFILKEDVEAGSYLVTVSYSAGGICNYDEEDISFAVVAGSVTVISYIPGDINDDGAVNNKDLTRLMKYLAGADVTVCEMALDTNGDGTVNNKDLTRLMKYLAGADVEIH